MREITLLGVEHPQFIDDWIRVDHPTVDPIVHGAPTLGWEGDPRLVVYLHQPSEAFALWRLEHDGEYRPVMHMTPGAELTPAGVNHVIGRLVASDTRRGHDAYATVIAAQDEQDRAVESRRRDASVDFADKFHFALARTHLPGIDVAKRVFPLNGG